MERFIGRWAVVVLAAWTMSIVLLSCKYRRMRWPLEIKASYPPKTSISGRITLDFFSKSGISLFFYELTEFCNFDEKALYGRSCFLCLFIHILNDHVNTGTVFKIF